MKFILLSLKMTKQHLYKVIEVVLTAAISVAAILLLDSCTASMSLFWKNQGSSQNTEQSTTTRIDSLKSPDVNLNF